ncbi:MAG: FecR domain-containing protein [Acidobacteria bacterium]|nr:FecR domain-containing protein [Acidobacteriota bacterium]
MKKATFGSIVLAAALAASATGPAGEPVSYRFDKVRSKVILVSQGREVRVSEGADATGGDVVKTGWLGSTLVAAPRWNARFEISSSSEVSLGSDQPGVILKLQQGRLKAIFDAFTGDEPRVVATPGALLAVRGTRYGVDVDGHGNTSVVVFEGTVQIDSFDHSFEPIAVHAGEMAEYGRGRRPEMHQSPSGMNETMWEQRGSRMPDGSRTSGGGQSGSEGGMMGQPGSQSGQPGGMGHSGGGTKRP